MGVATKYKSTGDMLTNAELVSGSRYRRKSMNSEGEDESDEELAIGGINKFLYLKENSLENESAKRKPLLKKKSRQQSNEEEEEDDEWYESCKFLGQRNRYNSSVLPQEQQRQPEAEEMKQENRKHWTSVGDFLALNNRANNRIEEQISGRLLTDQHEVDENSQFGDIWSVVVDKKPSVVISGQRTNSKRIVGIQRRWRANGARRKRVSPSSNSRMKLSLSSPVIAQRQVKQQQQQQQQLKTELNDEDDDLELCQLPEINSRLETSRDNSSGSNVDAYCGTKQAVAQPMDQNYEIRHCFVDVAHLQEQQQEQQQKQQHQQQREKEKQATVLQPTKEPTSKQRPSQEPQFSNGRSSSCSSSSRSNSCLRQDPLNECCKVNYDNGNGNGSSGFRYSVLEGEAGLCCNANTSTSTDTKAAAYGDGRQRDGGQTKLCSPEDCVQSANACNSNSSSSVLGLPNHRHHSRQEQQQHYVPASSTQVATGNPQSQAQVTGKVVGFEEKNRSLAHIGSTSHKAQCSKEGPLLVTDCSLGNYSNNNNLNNTTASKLLMESCCDTTWRFTLQPNKSGTYKVAQHHQLQPANTISGLQTEPRIVDSSVRPETVLNGQQEQSYIPTSWQLSAANRSVTERKLTNSTRFTRPGRSPRSLQRSTNARLARQRLKIQQQRQEQLAQLAIREQRQQQQQQHQNYNIQDIPQDRSSIFLINTPFDRFTSNSNNNEINNSTSNKSNRQRFSWHRGYNISQQHSGDIINPSTLSSNQQQLVITPPTTTRIEICDNQLACSSRGDTSRSATRTLTYHQQTPAKSSQRFGGNVIAYKSINMLRNGSYDDSGRGKSGGGDEIESDPDTISTEGSTLSLNKPFCKVCHIGATKNGDKLISPCRCSGTMQYIHCGCLLKWLEISNRSNEKPISCELCAHEYTWHKKFNYKHIGWPKCSKKDIVLHLIFLVAIGVMLFSALSPMFHTKSPDILSSTTTTTTTTTTPTSKGLLNTLPTGSSTVDQHHHHQSSKFRQQLSSAASNSITSTNRLKHSTGHLADDEKFTLICAASFFMSFFLAIYVQTKARDTLYGLIVKFLTMNQTYYITEYDHGQMNNNNANNKQQQQQLFVEEGSRGIDRKSLAQKS